ncbi:MAG: hypothetical protein A2W90_16925 [Bacteroidetes bacterium GWF2_42_66]|nr:MAG: hypothetical protein A2W92_03690 [Bacteroidetes bacterium GWA2_42_15]OFX96372.1 MAG: hypothetical protein A2W89_05855 [Bacteroidetes bacterium GWE2_42_39]OFY46411.1 MAG: hypothetical protein A2W90_16925 [Bacteroidetes bacterium GWF2_42_66]HAZ03724.1 hypothetical protein [Marinilabiliales bacterium]HBL78202.1 hypothetical protein [Prolixibacteraceae bacterium]
MKHKLVILVIALLSIVFATGNPAPNGYYKVHVAGKLPEIIYGYENEGFAGTFSGVVDDKLFIAGGANFPDKKPWEGGVKTFYDKIYVYTITGDSIIFYNDSSELSSPVAYGASVSLPEGVLCIGGNDSDKCFSSVFLLRWEEKYGDIVHENYPELPVPLSYTSAVLLEDKVYVAGGTSSVDGTDTGSHFYMLDLSKKKSGNFSWESLPAFPGKGRIFAVTAGQSNGTVPCVYLFSGRNVDEEKEITVFTDGLIYNPELKQWSPIVSDGSLNFPVMAGSAFSSGANSIVFVGGASGDLLLKEHQLRKNLDEIIRLRDTAAIVLYKEERLSYYLDHPGFSKDILLYNTITNTIVKTGAFETLCPVTTSIVPFKSGAILVSGEIKPGVRTPEIFLIQPVQQSFNFGGIKTIGILLFSIVLIIVGYVFLKKSGKRQRVGSQSV